eukprot:14350-Heterococcus_DN1.PRE.1
MCNAVYRVLLHLTAVSTVIYMQVLTSGLAQLAALGQAITAHFSSVSACRRIASVPLLLLTCKHAGHHGVRQLVGTYAIIDKSAHMMLPLKCTLHEH